MDDEIEYVGTARALFQATPNRPPLAPQQLIGIKLHIEQEEGLFDPMPVFVKRPRSNVIFLGRRPTAEPQLAPKDLEKGMVAFHCPIVSRKHAEISFADNGKVYLTDQGSHHGTHVRRAEEPTSTSLLPLEPRLLKDQDVITLGKVVNKDDDTVLPIVATIQFMPFTPPKTPVSNPRPIMARSANAGRYGLTTSSEEESSSSSDDSDIEELPRPSSAALVPGKRIDSLLSTSSSLLSRLVGSPLSPTPQPSNPVSPLSAFRECVLGRASAQSPVRGSCVREPVVIGAWPQTQPTDVRAVVPQSGASQASSKPIWRQELEDGIKDLKNEVKKLSENIQERDIKARGETSEDFKDLDLRIGEINGFCVSLMDQVDSMSQIDIPDMEAQIESIQEQLKEDKPHVVVMSDLPEVEHCLRTLRSTVDGVFSTKKEMEAVLDKSKETEAAIEAELQSAKALVADLAALKANAMVVDEVSTSSKRKREDVDESQEGVVAPPSPKRLRRLAKVVFRTSATVTVGAIAAWTALAFS